MRISKKLSGASNPPEFILGDYMNTNFPDDHFDVVYVNETLSHARDMKQVMGEFYRILKPGGRVVFADYEINTRQMPEKYQAMARLLRDHAGGYGVSQQNPGEIAQALREAGFVNVKEED